MSFNIEIFVNTKMSEYVHRAHRSFFTGYYFKIYRFRHCSRDASGHRIRNGSGSRFERDTRPRRVDNMATFLKVETGLLPLTESFRLCVRNPVLRFIFLRIGLFFCSGDVFLSLPPQCKVLRILAQHQAFARGATSGGPALVSTDSALGKPASKIFSNAVAESTDMSCSDNDADRCQSWSASRSENGNLETDRTERTDSAQVEIKPEGSTGQECFLCCRRASGVGFPVPEPPPLSLPPTLAAVGLGNDAQSQAEVVALELSGRSSAETGFVVCTNRGKNLKAKKNILRDEMLESNRELEDAELEAKDSEHMAAVTKHHLAVVLHAQVGFEHGGGGAHHGYRTEAHIRHASVAKDS